MVAEDVRAPRPSLTRWLGAASPLRLFLFALASRAFIAALIVFWGSVFTPYDESMRLADVDLRLPVARHGTRAAPALPYLWHWDAVHYKFLADYGYTHETEHVFFPLFPALIRVMSRVTPSYAFVAITALQWLMFAASVLVMRRLLRIMQTDVSCDAVASAALAGAGDRAVGIGVFFFVTSPASIFTVVSYTEPLFILATLVGVSALATPSPISVSRVVVSGVSFTVATLVRSNGILATGLVLLAGFRRRGVLSAIAITPVVAIAAAAPLLPYIVMNVFTYTAYCGGNDVDAAGVMGQVAALLPALWREAIVANPPSASNRTDWCDGASWLSPYSALQRKYWNLGWFTYYEARNVHHFAIAAPLFVAVALSVWPPLRLAFRRSDSKLMVMLRSPHTVWMLLMVAIAATRMHVQVSTRFLMVCPTLYAFVGARAAASKGYWKFLLTYVAVFVALGPLLFACFYPWT